MGREVDQLGMEERYEILRRSLEGRSLRQIALALHRAPSTISRQLKRNSGSRQDYSPRYGEEQARACRWSGGTLDRDADLRGRVLSRLGQGWSPEQIAGRLRRTLTFDNGTRFAHQEQVNADGIATCFCDPHAPWQKGGIENATGRMRPFPIRKTDLAPLDDRRFPRPCRRLQHTPPKVP